MIKIMPEPLFIECYQKIANNELHLRSELIKSIPAVFDEKYSEKELWKLHEYYMEVYREYKQKIYMNGNKAEKKTEKSLLDLKILIAERIIENCHLCHHRCGVNRNWARRSFAE
jgi:Uncharacterized Fe-S protein PflX, homolog of pyruvate formate lyase activating proteins